MGGVQLTWEGKRPPEEVMPTPTLTRVERYRGAESDPEAWANRLILGDNLAAMRALRTELAGQFALIYLDPPFFTGAEWQAKVADGKTRKSLPAYTDDWNGDLGAYLQWLLDRLALARELLAENGSLYVHLSWHAAHYVKLLLDELFGVARFQNEIIWAYREAINSKTRWNRKHDTLLFYTKGEKFTFNYDAVREPYRESNVRKYRLRDENGPYRLMGRGIVGSPIRSQRDVPPDYEAKYPGLTFRHYLGQGTLPVDCWQIDIENQASYARTGYPTQKPEALLERILLASSNPGDLIADFCCGSGTTLAVADRLGRRWVGCDAGTLAIHTTRKRLLENASRTGFVVEQVDRSGPLACVTEAWENRVGIEQSTEGIRLRLTDITCEQTDMWAVEWGAEAKLPGNPFTPDWWAVRTRRTPELPQTSPATSLLSVGRGGRSGCPLATVALTDAAGGTTCYTIPLDSDV